MAARQLLERFAVREPEPEQKVRELFVFCPRERRAVGPEHMRALIGAIPLQAACRLGERPVAVGTAVRRVALRDRRPAHDTGTL